MFKKIEALGSSFLERFVPKVEAEAWCQTRSWNYCYQCSNYANAACTATCCDSWDNCYNVRCHK